MKKLLSMILVLCLLASSLIACSKVSTKDVEKNPQEVLGEALEKTGSQFFTDDAGLKPFTAAAMKEGSIAISFESATVKEELGLGKITETIYFNKDQQKAVLDTAVNFRDKDLSARIFVDEKGILVNGASVLGSDTTYAIYPETLKTGFKESALAQMMGATEGEALTLMQETINAVAKAYMEAFEEDKKAAENRANELIATLQQTVTTEKVELSDGKNVKCVITTYTLTNETLRAFFDKVWEQTETDNAELKAGYDEEVNNLLNSATINATAKLCINAKTSMIETFDLNGTVTVGAEGEQAQTVEINANATFTEDKISVVVAGKANGEAESKLTADIVRAEENGVVTYTLTAKAEDAGVSVELLKASYAYTKKTGDFVVSVRVNEDEKTEEVSLTGNVKTEKNAATVAFNSIKAGEITVNFDLSITINKKAEMPAFPTEVKDVVTLTAEDIQKMMTDFQKSELGKLIFGFSDIMPF